MKKRCLLGLLIVSAALASMRGAVVSDCKGKVQVQAGSVWRPLRRGEQLSEKTRVRLWPGAQVSLLYRSDGHREQAQGPGDLLIGKEYASLAGGGKVQRFDFHHRPIEVPTSGGTDAVGGAVSNTSPMPAPMVLRPGSPITSMAVRTVQVVPPAVIEPAPLALAWQDEKLSLIAPLQGATFRGQVVISDGASEVASLSVSSDQPLDLDALDLQDDTLYLVRLVEEGQLRGTLTFRRLDTEEQQRLLDLNLVSGHSLERMEQFCQLGQYRRAVQEGEGLLRDAPSEQVLQLVYDLNRDILQDPRQAAYWKAWAEANELPLKE